MRSPTKILFRIAGREDIPLIRDLAARIWKEHYPGIITPAQIEYMLGEMYSADVILREIETPGCRYVLVLSGTDPAGFLSYVLEPSRQAIKISKLYLLPALHGRGIGKLMLGHVMENALRLQVKTVYLFVNKNNRKAIRAYERFGFTNAAETVTDIGGGFVMDDYRMELSVRP